MVKMIIMRMEVKIISAVHHFAIQKKTKKKKQQLKLIAVKGTLHPFALSFVSLETQSYF